MAGLAHTKVKNCEADLRAPDPSFLSPIALRNTKKFDFRKRHGSVKAPKLAKIAA